MGLKTLEMGLGVNHSYAELGCWVPIDLINLFSMQVRHPTVTW